MFLKKNLLGIINLSIGANRNIVDFLFNLGKNNAVAIECLPLLSTTLQGLLKYINGVINRKKVKYILKLIESTFERLKDTPEYNVLYKYAMEGKQYTLTYIGFMIILILVYFAMGAVLITKDILTKNETEDKYLMYPVEYYFFDAQDNYLFTSIHSCIVSAMAVYLIVSLDVMYITFIQHSCALFAITGYRLKTAHILDINILKNNEDLEKYKDIYLSEEEQEQVYKRVKISIKEHMITLEYTKHVQEMYSTTLFFQVAINIMLLSLTGLMMLLKRTNPTDVVRYATWLAGDVVHLFFLCLLGQRLMNFSEQLYYDALDCIWYLMYTKSRVLYQFLILNTLTPIKLTALKVISLNFETFLSVTQTAMSYFTVLSSTL
ncbi:uncharacterized protein LOC143185090 [Calliopsis andreniformis]|uniref:uncharacterized protein LOC143185090 n=1 Tax=Calliopsis andreniformis TaxID=337506 RepID=UPI003FCCB3F1